MGSPFLRGNTFRIIRKTLKKMFFEAQIPLLGGLFLELRDPHPSLFRNFLITPGRWVALLHCSGSAE